MLLSEIRDYDLVKEFVYERGSLDKDSIRNTTQIIRVGIFELRMFANNFNSS